ncbi:thermopsin family protease [Stygiolobus caldivivus]|uniref:Thermopsin n=1 Tax=Stygiolobus caldivivus TaxID=2824673 RepID=A0A8D5U592_9CREN|nr:thermopsin family protease [Stygiolobus caldivivus]BCU69323.1 thermopsin [Stygiolobus caldivivus]
MKLLPIFLIFILIAPTAGVLLLHAQSSSSYPIGMSFFPLTQIYYTNEVVGAVNISSMYIGSSYFPNGQYFTYGNASLQLNVMVDGLYWAQDVALFHEINSSSFDITFVVNVWDLGGPFTNSNITSGVVSTYQGLGVICYLGPTYKVSTPLSLVLFMLINSSYLDFGYQLGNKVDIYYSVPIGGQFQIGGLSVRGVPNDLEFVFGGPGGGSVVEMYVNGSEELYFENNGKLQIVPQAFSVGLDTAESVIGITSSANLSNICMPFTQLSYGRDDVKVLWPVKPQLDVKNNGSSVLVTLTYDGKPLQWQKVELEKFSFPSLLKTEEVGVTGSNGSVMFKYNSSSYVIYYPGNFSLSSTYYVSLPYLSSVTSFLKSAYDNLTSFISHYNFKKTISSFFGHKSSSIAYTSQVSINYTILLYILAFSIGVVISAILLKFKH